MPSKTAKELVEIWYSTGEITALHQVADTAAIQKIFGSGERVL